jgi:two-component system, LytTR family, sensor kinase
MRKLIFSILYCGGVLFLEGQQQWTPDSMAFRNIDWYNYATSYAGDGDLAKPTLVTAIPYNGVYSYFDNSNAGRGLPIDSALFDFNQLQKANSQEFDTYDSSAVYFLAPGIFRYNAHQYQYRVLLNGKTIVKPWTGITQFADSGFQLNDFKKGMAFLGGYKTVWNNCLVVQLRKESERKIISLTTVHWTEIKPALLNIYTADELNGFLARLKKSYDQSMTKEERSKWTENYPSEALDPNNLLPRKLLLKAKEDNLVFYLLGDFYKKEALEYQLLKNDRVYINWKSNDFDNNFIWLKNLLPGVYKLQMRYRSQRQNISTYAFEINSEWYQHPALKVGIGVLAGIFLVLLFRLRKQQAIAAAEKFKKEKLSFELKALRAQLNPHFVFNALSSIQGLINKGEIAAANHYLTEFSSLLRDSLKNNDRDWMPLTRELKMMETYIGLEQLRFGFQYSLSVSEEIPADEVEIPSLLIQPVIENAIKHGVGPKTKKGVISVRVFSKKKNLFIEIADNGNGFDSTKSTQGLGLKMIKERTELLNQTLSNQQIELLTTSNTCSGSCLTFIFKSWL